MKKVVVITGASSGIGEAIAKLLANDYYLVLAARREDRLKKLVEEINNAGGHAVFYLTDVSKHDQVESLAQFAIQQFNQIDVWINNAGIMPQSWLKSKRVDEWDQMIDINLKGTLYGIGAALPYMREQKHGQIINISSVAGLKVAAGSAVYCGTKYAVKAITEGLRQEVALDRDNIRVTAVYPGAVNTELYDSIKDETMRQEMVEFYKTNGLIAPERIAVVIKQAIELPDDSALNDLVIRPINQVF